MSSGAITTVPTQEKGRGNALPGQAVYVKDPGIGETLIGNDQCGWLEIGTIHAWGHW